MKKVLILVFVCLGILSSAEAKKFDFSCVNGLKPGISKRAALEILENNKLKYTVQNNSDGGKFYEVESDSSFGGVKIITIRFAFENSKISALAVDPVGNNGDIEKYLDKECNCMVYNELGNFTSYAFDNCTIIVRDDGTVQISKIKTKCKD